MKKSIKFQSKDVLIAWNCVAMTLKIEEVNKEEEKFLFTVLEDLAAQHRKSTKPYNIKLEVDQFKAIWHSIKVCREKDLIPEKKDSSAWTVFAKVADLIDKDITINTDPGILLEQ